MRNADLGALPAVHLFRLMESWHNPVQRLPNAGGIILLLTMPIGTGLVFNGWSLLVMFLNGAVFSAIGVVVSFLAKNHADVPRFSNYIICLLYTSDAADE